MNNPFNHSSIKNPVYHGSNSYFTEFSITYDIGYHFGTRKASIDRMISTGGAPEVTMKDNYPGKFSYYCYKASLIDYDNPSDKSQIAYLLLRKLDNANLSSIKKQLDTMDDIELNQLYDEYINKSDSQNYLNNVKKFIEYNKTGLLYRIFVDEYLVDEISDKEVTDKKVLEYKERILKPRKFWINLENPLTVSDLGMWSPHDIIKEIGIDSSTSDYIMSFNDRKERYDVLRKLIIKLGYDGFVYKNTVEDSGSTSYIVFYNDQIKEIFD